MLSKILTINKSFLLTLSLIMGLSFFISACDSDVEDKTEDAFESVEDGAEKVEDKAQDAADAVEDSAEEAMDAAEDKYDKLKK